MTEHTPEQLASRIEKLEGDLAFTQHDLDQVSAQVVHLQNAAEQSDKRVEALERRLRELLAKQDDQLGPPQDEPTDPGDFLP